MKSRPSALAAIVLASVALSACTTSVSTSTAKPSGHDVSSTPPAQQRQRTQAGGAATTGKSKDSSSLSAPAPSHAATPQIGVPIAYALLGATAKITINKVTMQAKPTVGRVPAGRQYIAIKVTIVVTRGVFAKDGTGGYYANANLGDSLQLADGTIVDQAR
jgi:hypothetical protein